MSQRLIIVADLGENFAEPVITLGQVSYGLGVIGIRRSQRRTNRERLTITGKRSRRITEVGTHIAALHIAHFKVSRRQFALNRNVARRLLGQAVEVL